MTVTAIEAAHITKRYPNGTVALDDVSLSVDFGEVVACLGRNGAGKTTLVRILASLARPTSGEARVCGFDTVAQRRQVRSALGASLQQTALDELLTPREHLRLAARLSGLSGARMNARIDELIDTFGLGDVVDRMVATLSGGTARRLDLAVALITQPLVLFLDEPTTGLDPQSRRGLWDWVRGYVNRGGALLLTTQYLEEADELAGRVAILDRGRRIVLDSPSGLKATIGGKVLLCRHEDAATRELARKVLGIPSQDAGHDDGPIRADLPGDDRLPAILEALQTAGVPLSRVSITEPTLEDVFVRLTGGDMAGEVGGEATAGVAAIGRSLATKRKDR